MQQRSFLYALLSVLTAHGLAAAQGAADGASPAAADSSPANAGSESPPPTDEEESGPDPTRPPSAGKGAVWGILTDTKLHQPLMEATVKVVGSKVETVTDLDGRFRLELPPGTYSLRFFYELHTPLRLDRIIVTEGRVTRYDAELEPESGAMDVIEVETEANRSTIEGEILSRQRSAAVGDSVGRVEIAKSPDRNAAQAAQRVVGATIVGNRFVYVRGLGERYTNALINGTPLPSPEPDRAAVPLDLFPTAVLNSLTIAKTFTPDVPGDFAGGSVRIETREIPGKLLFQASVNGGFNTQSTFRSRLDYEGGSTDWLGLDDGSRELPNVPSYKLARGATRPDGTRVTEPDLVEPGRQLNTPISKTTSGTPFDHGATVVVGNGWDFGQGRKLGVLGSINYGHSYTIRENERRVLYERNLDDPRGFSETRNYTIDTGAETVSWGAFGSVSYRFSNEHKLTLLGLRSTLNDDTTQLIEGYHIARNIDIRANRLAFVTRALNMGQLSGEHDFPALGGSKLEWNATLSQATRYEPDTRDIVWGLGNDEDAMYRFTDAPESGRHFFADQAETQRGAGIDWTQPVIPRSEDLKLKFGALASLRDREFWSRTFRFRRVGNGNRPIFRCEDGDIDRCSRELLTDENVGPAITMEEGTKPTDTYDATLNIIAGYVMTDAALTDDLRLIVGERIEHTNQSIDPYDQFDLQEPPAGAKISQTDLLPSASLVWSATDTSKLRFAVTRTLARPQLRELAPFAFTDFFGGRIVSGNPELKLTQITNFDLRFEHFPTLREVLAFSLFYKEFENPIETVLIRSGGEESSITYRNAAGANLIGIELEARKNLGFVHTALDNFGVVTNLTLSQSKIKLSAEDVISLTNLSRPLMNQAPYVYNLSLDYTNEDLGFTGRALYNIVGPRIAEVGSRGLVDAYEHPRHMLDFTLAQEIVKHFQLKFAIKNLLNSPVVITQGCGNEGVFGSTWRLSCKETDTNIARKYTEGATYTLTAQYSY
jgi:outer membrane receptor protein involved in Fe transport